MTHLNESPPDWLALARHYRRTGEWDEALGHVPQHPETDVPPDVLEKAGIKTDPSLRKPPKPSGHVVQEPRHEQLPPVEPEVPGLDERVEASRKAPTQLPDDGYTGQIIAEMRAAGIEHLPSQFTADGNIHRFMSRPGSQKRNGWYVVHPDPVMPTWAFGDWSLHLKKHGRGTPGRELTPDEISALEQRQCEQQEKVRTERDRAWKDAAAEAQQRWNTAKNAPKSHPYLKKQQIEPCGAKVENGNLLIPMRDIEGKLWSVQEINTDWKSNQPGGRRKGCFTKIGDIVQSEIGGEMRDVLIVCEGFATGASLHMATGWAVFAAGDAHNLEKVAPILREKHKDAVIIVAGDDDWLARYKDGKPDNTGKIAAEKAASTVDGILVFPWFNPKGARPPKATDFNDEHKQYGLGEVRTTLKLAIDKYDETREKAAEHERDAEPPLPSGPGDYGLSVSARPDIDWPDLGKGGMPSSSCANARMAIEALGISSRYDNFHDRKLVGGHVIDQWAGELSDHAVQILRVIIKERFGFDPGRDNTHDAAVQLCLQHQFDPVLDYLDSLTWDGTRRLDTWLCDYLGADDTKLNRAIGRLVLMAAVRRARHPGFKFDQILVLEGPEGKGKSSAIEMLAGKENFSDQTILGLDDRQQQEAVRGVWLYEIADLAGMSKADVDKTKAFASRQTDRARPAYGRQRIDQPRRCIFIATTNNDTYLKSQTGNRRFWPVRTGHVDLSGLQQDRDQLWAEAACAEATTASLTLPETLWAEAATEQDRRRDLDPWDELLAGVTGFICDSADGHSQEERISTTELLQVRLGLPPEKCTDVNAKHLGFVMKRLGWEKPSDPIRIPGQGKVRGFRRPYPPPPPEE